MSVKKEVFILSSVSLILIIPYVWFFPHVFVNAHDNLDIDVIRYMLCARKEYIFADSMKIIPEMMCGLPRMVFDSEFYYPVWLFYFFHPYTAVVLNMVIVHVVAFVSAYLLGKYLLGKQLYNSLWVFVLLLLISICYACMQEQHLLNLGLSIALSPLVLRSILRLYSKEGRMTDYVVLFLFPFVSRLTHVGFFWLFFLLMFLTLDFFKQRQINVSVLKSFLVLVCGYIIVEHRLLNGLFIDHFQSHRYEFNLNHLGGRQVLKKFIEFLWWGDYQARAMLYAVWALVFFVFILKIFKRVNIDKADMRRAVVFVGLILFCAIVSSLAKSVYLREMIRYLNFFDMSRFAFLLPTLGLGLVYILIDLILNKALIDIQLRLVCVYVVVFFAFVMAMKYNHTVKDYCKQILKFGKPEVNNSFYFYLDEFYAVDLFEAIKKDLPYPISEYRVGSIGIHPALSLFNGFYTIDGAIANYPLSYKKKFREIIREEIQRQSHLKSYYDDYGCRAYLFSSELFMNDKVGEKVIYPKYNTKVLRELNCKYIFSSAKVGNADELKWRYIRHYQNKNYSIYVYEVL